MEATKLGRGPRTLAECQGVAQRAIADDDRDPRLSPLTAAVCLAVAAGYRWGKPRPYLDVVEEVEGRMRRRVTWAFDSGSTARIDGENVGFGAFWERLHDAALSPEGSAMRQLAQAQALLEMLEPAHRAEKLLQWGADARLDGRAREICAAAAGILADFRAERPPRFLLVRRARGTGETRVYIPFHATPEERAALLREAGMG